MTWRSKKREVFWLDEVDPAELERRARDLERDGLITAAAELRKRADWLRGYIE
jgi:hypothetical protein